MTKDTDTRMTIAATGQEWIRADEVQAQLAEARREALRELRSKWLVRDLTQSDFIDAEAPAQPKPDAVQEAAQLLADAMERREWAFYPIEMPINESGYGPATVGVDATSITYEVWEANTLRSVSSHETLPDAIADALRALAGGEDDV